MIFIKSIREKIKSKRKMICTSNKIICLVRRLIKPTAERKRTWKIKRF